MTKKRKAGKSSKKSARKQKRPGMRSESVAWSDAASERMGVAERLEAMTESPVASTDKEESLEAVLRVLRNKAEPMPVRLAALQTMQAASFGSPAFEAVRGDYIAILREVALDTDKELCWRALGILAREKDGFAQKKLLEGLENPEKALVPPEKALQLLSYDVHAEAYAIARKIIKNPPSDIARREALRLLAADATAAPIFEKLLRDKDELAEVRQISASALQALKPDKLQEHAREMALDNSEYDEIRATSLTALTQFGEESIADDAALMKGVEKLSDKAPTKVKQSARQFIKEYKR
jgi:hypothetical protein